MIGELMYRQNKRRQAKAYFSAVAPKIGYLVKSEIPLRSSCRTRKA